MPSSVYVSGLEMPSLGNRDKNRSKLMSSDTVNTSTYSFQALC